MIFILIILLIFLLFIIYYVFEKDIFSPSVISIIMFIFSACFVFINRNNWSINITIKTVILIFGGILPLICGEWLVRIVYCKNKYKISYIKRKSIPPEKVYIKNKWCIISIVLLVTYFIYKLLYVYTTARLYGISDTLLGSYRNISASGEIETNYIVKVFDLLTNCIAYIFTYVVINNMIFRKRLKKIYLIPIILYILVSILSSSRIQFIFFITYILVLWYIMLQNKYDWHYNFSGKFIRNGFIFIIVFFIAFYFLGFLTGKSTGINIFNYMSLYIGGSIPALDVRLQYFKYDINNFGVTTLIGLNNIFKYIGLTDLDLSRNLNFTDIGAAMRTNVYTCYGRLLNDYGYLGMILIRFFMGLVYTDVYMKIKYKYYKKNEDLIILLYAFSFHPIVMQAIDETFFKNIISITVLIQIIIFYIMFRMLKKNIKVKT